MKVKLLVHMWRWFYTTHWMMHCFTSPKEQDYEEEPSDFFLLLRPSAFPQDLPSHHQLSLNPASSRARMIKGQACHLVSRPSLKGRQKKRKRERGRKTPWHTGLMKAMNHGVVFKEHISGIINSAQRPGLGWTDRSLHQQTSCPTPCHPPLPLCLSYPQELPLIREAPILPHAVWLLVLDYFPRETWERSEV